ncbi:MAG TPA: VOC family protein [Steroidobacteraceae bacterium]|nr:VOC family protein [Steroidobacteraceae bacterium]
MKPTPKGWPRISAGLYYRNAAVMIDWLCLAFGFEVRLRVEGEDGRIAHSELSYGDAVVMVGEERRGDAQRFGHDAASPVSVGGANTQSLLVYVDDVDAHCARARAAGARIADEPKLHDYGAEYWADRSYGAADPEGHLWWFTQRIRDPAR